MLSARYEILSNLFRPPVSIPTTPSRTREAATGPMALLRSKLENQIRPSNKEFEWQESIDDLFDSFINPDSFHFSDNEVERNHSDDLINLFDTHTTSSGSDTIDTSPMLDLDAKAADADFSWLQIPPPFGEENGALSAFRDSIYPASRGKTAASDSDLLGLDFQSTSINSPHLKYPVYRPTCPSTPVPFSLKQFSAPLVIRTKQRNPPSRIEKHSKSSTGLPGKMMSPSSYKQQALWARRIGAAADQLNLKIPFEAKPAALPSPSPGRLKSGSLNDYPFASDHTKPGPYAEEIEPLSPFSNFQHHFQPPNTPIASPIFDDRQPGSRTSFHEALSSGFPKTPMNQHSDPFSSLITPPQSAQMSSANWLSAFDDQSISASPAFSVPGDKADSWWSSSTTGESTCGATPSASLIGLGIEGMQMSGNVTSASSLMIPCDPSPAFTAPMVAATSTPGSVVPSLVNGINRPLASPISVSASSSPNLHYPLSPLQSMSQGQQQSQRQTQQQPTFYRRHQRHHTVGTPIAISQAGPCNTRSTRLNSASPASTAIRPAHTHKRSKSSYQARRKSSAEKGNSSSQDNPRSASIGFVNFTPSDSKKILTGVAPSGSSKTKARREKEAAEKRRKLSEAAKKAVLEAGGDLTALEREGLLVLEQGL